MLLSRSIFIAKKFSKLKLFLLHNRTKWIQYVIIITITLVIVVTLIFNRQPTKEQKHLKIFQRFHQRKNLMTKFCQLKDAKVKENLQLARSQAKWYEMPFVLLHSTTNHYSICLSPKTGSSSVFHLIWDLENPGKGLPIIDGLKADKDLEWGNRFYDKVSTDYGRETFKFKNPLLKKTLFNIDYFEKPHPLAASPVEDEDGDDIFKDLEAGWFEKNLEFFNKIIQKSEKSTTLKIITVRHPLTRFFSSWNDHMAIRDGKKIGEQWKYLGITEKDHETISEKITKDLHSISWQNFVNRMIWVKQSQGDHGIKIDEHHLPINEICQVCNLIEYDYIIKLETMEDDINFILEKEFSELVDEFKISLTHVYHHSSSWDPYSNLKYYCKLSDSMIREIERYFEEDFKIFGYEKFDRKENCR